MENLSDTEEISVCLSLESAADLLLIVSFPSLIKGATKNTLVLIFATSRITLWMYQIYFQFLC